MIVASFHSCGAPPPCHTPITTAWNCSTVAYGCYHRNLHLRRVLSGPAGISSGPTAFRFDMLVIVSSTSKMEGRSSRGVHGGHTLSSSTILGSSARWRLSVDQRDEPLFPTIANEPHVTKQNCRLRPRCIEIRTIPPPARNSSPCGTCRNQIGRHLWCESHKLTDEFLE